MTRSGSSSAGGKLLSISKPLPEPTSLSNKRARTAEASRPALTYSAVSSGKRAETHKSRTALARVNAACTVASSVSLVEAISGSIRLLIPAVLQAWVIINASLVESLTTGSVGPGWVGSLSATGSGSTACSWSSNA
ncbi:hypothetical protein D3C77_525270 [compost metagenome]